jgi:hypothetical protein
MSRAISSNGELARYSISVHDFEKALKFISAAKKHGKSSVEYEALMMAAIVSYYRPFSSNERSSKEGTKPLKAKSSLSIDDFGPLTDFQKELHERFKTLRNKLLAHSEFAYNPTSFDPETKIFSGKTFSLLNETFDLDSIEAILKSFEEICHKKRGDYSSRAPAS